MTTPPVTLSPLAACCPSPAWPWSYYCYATAERYAPLAFLAVRLGLGIHQIERLDAGPRLRLSPVCRRLAIGAGLAREGGWE